MWAQHGSNPTHILLTRKQAHGYGCMPEAGESNLGGCPGGKSMSLGKYFVASCYHFYASVL